MIEEVWPMVDEKLKAGNLNAIDGEREGENTLG